MKNLGLITILMCIYLMIPGYSQAGNFKIAPVVINIGAKEKTSVFNIKNLGDEKVTIQIHAKRWRQNSNGDDLYDDTGDIVIFPRIADIEKGQERIIRLGYQGKKVPTVEETYKLIVEELPVKEPGKKVLRFALKMKLPVFRSPIKEIIERSIEKVELRDGKLFVTVKNSGNTHFPIRKMTVLGLDDSGSEVFSSETASSYILAGVSRSYSIKLHKEECRKARTVKVTVEGKKASIISSMKIDNAMCK